MWLNAIKAKSSDQHQFTPNNVSTLLIETFMRINKIPQNSGNKPLQI